MFSGSTRRRTLREGSGSKTFPTERLLTDHGAVDDVELVAAQQGLAAQLLQLLVAAVVGQAAPGGQTRGGGALPWVGPGHGGCQLEALGAKDSPASSPRDRKALKIRR